MKSLLCIAIVLVMSGSLALAQSLSLDNFPKDANGNYNANGQYSCTDVHQGVCMAFCRDNKRGGTCAVDCDQRQKYCLATGSYLVRQSSGTLANNLRKE